MTNSDNFEIIYDTMNKSYEELEEVMSTIYQFTQTNPENENAKAILAKLGDVAKKMIGSQREFATSYGSPEFKDVLEERLSNKEQALDIALGETTGLKM